MKKSIAALSAAVLAVCVGDFALTHSRLIADSDYFVKNDFIKHKVFINRAHSFYNIM